MPRVGEPPSSSCPPDQDDEEQEQVIVTRTLASLNQANSGKVPHQMEKQQSNNRPSSRRSYPKPNTSFYRPYMQNQAFPSVPPDQAMYHLWHRMQATQPTPRFPVVPAMGNTRFPPPAAMLPMYPPPRGQFSNPANQDALGLLPCFPEAAPALPRYFSPYPVSYVPRSPLPVTTVHKIHEKRQDHTEIVQLPDSVVFSQCTTLDSFSTLECGGPSRKVQEPTKNGKEGCTGSSTSPKEEHNTLTVSSSTAQPSSQKLEPNEDKQTLKAGLKQPHEQQLMSSSSCVSPVEAQSSVQRKHYASSIQHDEPIHRRNPPRTNPPALPDLWSSCSQPLPRFGSAPPVNSSSSVFQQRPPWLAAPVTVRTAVPVCSARPNVVNSTTVTAPARPSAQNRSASARAELESQTHNGDRDLNNAATASSEFNKLHI